MLRSLHLSMNGVGVPGAMFAGDMLTSNESLTYLDISFNRIHDQGVEFIAAGLQKNEALHHLIVHLLAFYSFQINLFLWIRSNYLYF